MFRRMILVVLSVLVVVLSSCVAAAVPQQGKEGYITVDNNHGFAVYFPNRDFFVPKDAARDVVVSTDCRVVAIVSRNFENFSDEFRSALDILVIGQDLEKHVHLPGLWLSPNFNKANNKLVVRKTLDTVLYQIIVIDMTTMEPEVILETPMKVFNVDWLGDNIIMEEIDRGVHRYFALSLEGQQIGTTEVDSSFFRYQPGITSQECQPGNKQ